MPEERKRSSKVTRGSPENSDPISTPYATERELICVTKPEAGLRATREGVTSITGMDTAPLSKVLAEEGVSLLPLFGASEERLQHETMSLAATAIPGAQIPNLSVYYFVPAPDERLEEIAAKLLQQPGVDGAYVKPRAELAQTGMGVARGAVLNDMAPLPQDAPPLSPDFTARQLYLGAAPVGIDARYAWTQTGGAGFDVRIIDCEWAWRFTHEDLVQTQGGAVVGTPNTNLAFRNHGTAVVGEFSGDRNAFGITGICPDATVSGAAFSGPTAATIRQAADRLRPGDILLLEIHRAGPHATGIGQQGYIAIEWWPDDFDAIRYAISKGVLVVEAAGNGAENLDDPIYSIRPAGFPSTWTNPFNRANRDSGAIVVGAGSPPPGTHGRDWGPDRSRLDFSNYGALIDAQGWGREVTTTGYGDLQGGVSEDLWYTDQFSGTSSASPIVVGALGCVQGYLRAHGRIPLTPARARDLLRTTGSPQQDAPGRPRTQRIGNRPNLRQMIPAVAPVPQPFVGVQFRGTIPAGQTRRWFTFNWPSQWHVLWTVMPTSVTPGGPQIRWNVLVERASDRFITYWIDITNTSSASADIEARYAVLGW